MKPRRLKIGARSPRPRTAAAAVLIAAAAIAVASWPTNAARAARTVARSHVVVLLMENKENSDVLGSSAAPYANALARRYGVATQSFAITHPSLPNYLALTSGSTDGISSDCTSCTVKAANIVDQLTRAAVSWKAYLQDVPTGCFKGSGAGTYAKRHNPFIYYTDVADNPQRCAHLVGFTALASDLRSGRLPTYSWITPNLCNDTHDCGVAQGDSFLAKVVPTLVRALGPQGFLVLTWDEGVSNAGCCGGAAGGHVATIVVGPQVIPGSREAGPVDHYGVLATVEQALGLPLLGAAADVRNGRLTPLFRSPPVIR